MLSDHQHNMVVISATTCPKAGCGKADFRRLKCTVSKCGEIQSDTGTCPGHQPTKTKHR